MADTWFTASWRLSASLNSPSRYSWLRSRSSSDTSRHGVTVYRGIGAEMARASIEFFPRGAVELGSKLLECENRELTPRDVLA